MTSREITTLAIRVFAIYVLVQAILTLPSFMYPIADYVELAQKGWTWVWMSGGLSRLSQNGS